MDAHYDVDLYVYDITKGLARQFSQFLLDGKQIEGVWHTGTVVYGREYTFGGDGIGYSTPRGTILGSPDEIISLGQTQIPLEMFEEYIQQLGTSTFRGDCYNLLHHNCNTFSNEIANFLTGRSIPDKITGLPEDILNSSLGTMLKPFLDSMSMSHSPVQATSGSGQSTPSRSDGSSQNQSSGSGQGCATNMLPARNNEIKKPVAQLGAPIVHVYFDSNILDSYRQTLKALKLNAANANLLEEVLDYLTTAECDWSLTRMHTNALCRLISERNSAGEINLFAAGLLSMALSRPDVVDVCKHDPAKNYFVLLERCETLDKNIIAFLSKSVCNFLLPDVGAECIFEDSSILDVLVKFCQFCLLNDDSEISTTGCQIACNILMHDKVSADLALTLGVSLIERCCQDHENAASTDFLWYSLCRCVSFNPQLCDIAKAVGLNIAEQEIKYPNISKYVNTIRSSLN